MNHLCEDVWFCIIVYYYIALLGSLTKYVVNLCGQLLGMSLLNPGPFIVAFTSEVSHLLLKLVIKSAIEQYSFVVVLSDCLAPVSTPNTHFYDDDDDISCYNKQCSAICWSMSVSIARIILSK